MRKPIVSTITPCYRMTKYLRTFLEWLPKQTYFEQLEVVLDHNEPSPEEIEWVRDFQERYPGRLKHIVVEKVEPIGVSMNRCIQEASGEFLAIWNVDDLRTPESIEAQAQLLIDNSDTDIVYGDYVVVSCFGATMGSNVSHQALPESEFTRSMIFGPFFMFRKSLCRNAGFFDEQLKSGADFDFAVRLAAHGKAAIARSPLGFYLNEGLGASTRPNSLQPVERTVVELRYGIYDKIDYSFLPRALKYDIGHVHYCSDAISLSDVFPNYDSWMELRRKAWFEEGIEKYYKKRKSQFSTVSRGSAAVRKIVGRLKRLT